MVKGRPCNGTISLTNKHAIWDVSEVLAHGMKCVILENRSMATKIKSYQVTVLDRPNTKSILKLCQGLVGTSKRV